MTSSHKLFLLFAIYATFTYISHATTLESSDSILSYSEYFGIEDPQELSSIVNLLKDLKDIYQQILHIRHTVANSSIETMEIMDLFNVIETGRVCNSCQNFVGTIRNHLEDDKAISIVEKTAVFFCGLGMNKTLCQQAISTYGPISLTSLVDKFISPTKFCQEIFLCPHTHNKETVKQYAEEVLKDKPITRIPNPTKKSTYNILQLADVHVDLKYETGANAFCHDPLCCRAENGAPKDTSQEAQYWGTVSKCDIPMRTFEQFLQFVSKNFEVDFILWTGDNISHDIWGQAKETQTVNTKDITQEIMKYFPNTTVYPMFGNHEAYPGDDFDTVGNESQWLLDELSDMWKPWLEEQALESFRKKSYYSTVNQKLGVKIIALDTQACDTADFYLMRAPTDPMHELEWLRNELYESESKNQSVIIMGHIPPGTPSCDSEWSGRYSALVDRFTNIIRGQYFAHTHNDHIEMIRSPIEKTPVGAVFIAPSFTTYTNLRPSFRIIEVDSETHQPVNIYQYRLDLEKWNKNTTGPIEWDLAYNFLEEYQLVSLSFEELDNLSDRLKDDSELAQTYVFNYVSGAQPRTKLTKRETQHFYCQAKNAVYIDMLKCLGLQAKVGDILLLAGQLMPGAWEFNRC